MRFLELGNHSILFTVLPYLIIGVSHDLLYLLIKHGPIDPSLLQRQHVFLNRILLPTSSALHLFLSDSEHFLVIFDEQVESVPLKLIERAVVPVVILDLLLKVLLKHGFRLPGRLAVGETPPLHEVQLVHIVFARDGFLHIGLAQVGARF